MVSNIGTWVQAVTAAVLMYDLTGSTFMVGLLAFASFVPLFVLSVPGGILADRFGYRRVVVVAHLLSLLPATWLTVAAFRDAVTPTLLITTGAAFGVAYALAKPALSAILPSLVPRESLQRATAVNTLQFTLGQVAGSLLSAVLLGVAGPPWAFLTNGVSFLLPVVAMAVIGAVQPGRRRGGGTTDSGGVGRLLTSGTIPLVLVAVVFANVTVEALRTVAPVLVAEVLGGSSDQAGLLVGASSTGTLVGLLVFSPVHRRWGDARVVALSAGLTAVGAVMVALSPSLPWACAGAALIGAGFAWSIPVLNATLQVLAPPGGRGRVMSLFAMAHLGVRPFFALVAGASAMAIGAPVTLALFGGLALLGVAVRPLRGHPGGS